MNVFQDNLSSFNPYVMTQSQKKHDKNPRLFNPEEAIMLGNLFKDLYMSYNGFSNYFLQPQNRRQQALLEVQMYGFVAHEINLYLDMHPNNQRMVQLYNEYSQKAKEATRTFEKEFGPLSVQESSDKIPFDWVQGPWPWEYQ